jgi:hypothetical protein
MKIDLHNYKQEKMSVTEYEVGFNMIVHFVPHVACDEIEKAGRFRQGLKPSIRHTLGAFPLVDFHATVEQALGVEMQQQYTHEMQKSLGTDNSRSQDDKKGHSGGPVHKKDKSHRHQPYRGKSVQSSALGTTPQYRAWDWCASVVVMHIDVLSVSGLGGVLYAVRTIRMWCAGRIQIRRFVGS